MSRFGRLFDKFRSARPAEHDEGATARSEMRWIVAGLGNPGEQYRRSRHNAGFMAVQRFAGKFSAELNRRKFNGLFAEISTDAGPAIAVTPQTFYNRSGDCVSAISGYFKVPAERLIVVHDEMDLPMGQLRIKRGGSDAGNRGVRSVAQSIGTPEFIRIRIGIGHPDDTGDSINHVLKPLTGGEMRTFEAAIGRAADAIGAIMRDGLERAMNVYNQRA
jgi:peptidyl-tRNA hydrolase, PTH1 family